MSEEIEKLVPVGQPRLVRQSFDTPRTDAADRQSRHFLRGFRYLEMRDTARDLERELCELREAVARLDYQRNLREPNKIDAPGHSHDVHSHLDIDGSLCSWCDAWDQARAALQSLPNSGISSASANDIR